MVSRTFQDAWNVALSRKLVNERSLMVTLGFSALVVFVALITLITSLSSVPTVRPAPQIPPVTEVPAAVPVHVVPVALTVSVSAPAEENTVEYVVRSGDTLIAIARRYCSDYLAIARDNAIVDPNWIYAGKTVLKFKNGCIGNAPSVLVKQSVSPRELVRNDRASSGKHLPMLVIRAPEASPLPIPAIPESSLAASAAPSSASEPIRADASVVAKEPQPLSELRHREIYRIVALRNLGKGRTRTENAELVRLMALIREEVLVRYKLPNPDCLYAEASTLGKSWEEQTLARVRCIRENYGAVIDEVAAERKLESAYIEAVIMAESEGRPDAISPTGCTGLKQFTQRSAKLFGLADRFDPFESIRAGGRHLEDNLRMWRGNVAKATAHWNIGLVTVRQAGFDAAQFPFTRKVLRIQRLIEKESRRVASSGQPVLVPIAYTPAR